MSVRSRNWLKFGSLVGLAFMLGLLFAGVLELPSATQAQSQSGLLPQATSYQAAAPAVTRQPGVVSSPAADMLVALSDAFADVAESVKPSVVFIRSQKTNTAPAATAPAGHGAVVSAQPTGAPGRAGRRHGIRGIGGRPHPDEQPRRRGGGQGDRRALRPADLRRDRGRHRPQHRYRRGPDQGDRAQAGEPRQQ